MLPGLTSAVVGGAVIPKGAVYTAFTFDDVSRSTYTFSSAALGIPQDNRYIAVAIINSDEVSSRATISSVTVAGQACSEKVSTFVSSFAGNPRTSIFLTDAPVTSGETGNIVVTLSNTDTSCCIIVWAVYGLTSTTAHDTATDTGTTLSATIDYPANGILIAATANQSSGASATWTGATENADGNRGDSSGASGASASNLSSASGQTISVAWSATTIADQMCAATFT